MTRPPKLGGRAAPAARAASQCAGGDPGRCFVLSAALLPDFAAGSALACPSAAAATQLHAAGVVWSPAMLPAGGGLWVAAHGSSACSRQLRLPTTLGSLLPRRPPLPAHGLLRPPPSRRHLYHTKPLGSPVPPLTVHCLQHVCRSHLLAPSAMQTTNNTLDVTHDLHASPRGIAVLAPLLHMAAAMGETGAKGRGHCRGQLPAHLRPHGVMFPASGAHSHAFACVQQPAH